MTKPQRITSFLTGIVLIAFCAVLLLFPVDGCSIIAAVLSIGLILKGLQMLIYYLTMARFMVGGKDMLYRGVIILDLGAFIATMIDEPRIYIVVFIVAYYAFAALVNILRSVEDKRLGAPTWKINLLQGVTDLFIAVASIVYIRSYQVLVVLFCAGLAYSALIRITSAFSVRTE